MLNRYLLFSTSRHLLTRATLSTVPYPSASETEVGPDGTAKNFPKVKSPINDESEKIDDPVPLNDLLQKSPTSPSADKSNVLSSAEKVAAGLTPRPANSSIAPTPQLFQDAKVTNTLVLPGIPVSATVPPPLNREVPAPSHEESVPSSRFTAFLRSIRSGLPFFPAKKTKDPSMDIATTREHFLPLTRPSLIRLIATDHSLLTEEERFLFHSLCEGFDSAVVQRYHPILNELKHLFQPLNPDQDDLDRSRDQLESEYWLLQKIDDLLHRSNFTELPRDVLLEKFQSSDNIQINAHDYDVLKFWILGREQIPFEELSRWKRWFTRTTSKRRGSNDYFKRIIVAVRLKGQDRLYFKAFRDIPLDHLPQLLPVGKLRSSAEERRQIRWTLLVGSATAVTYLITTMAELNLPALWIGGSALTTLMALRAYRNSFRVKIDYLAQINRVLFYKNIASNKQLLAMIVDRAEDELSKEVLLTYITTLWKQKQNADLTARMLELEVENWILLKLNKQIHFNSEQSIEFLRKLGILLPEDPSRPGCIQVVPLKQVVGILPKLTRGLSEKNEEWDLIEGYDKKYFEVDWKSILHEDQLLKKAGWH